MDKCDAEFIEDLIDTIRYLERKDGVLVPESEAIKYLRRLGKIK